MATRFSEDDLGQEVSSLQPRPVGRIEGFESAEYALQYAKASVARVISSDPDAMYAFMGHTSRAVVQHATAAQTALTALSSLLSAAQGPDTRLNETLLLDIADEFTELKDTTYRTKLRKLERIKSHTRRLIASSTGGGSALGAFKDPVEVRREIRARLSQFLNRMGYMRSLHASFLAAIDDYLVSGLVVIAAEMQSDLVAERLREFEGQGGRNISRALLRLMAGIATVDERLAVRDWSAPKYTGALTVLSGEAPYSVSARSLPLADATPGSISVTLTADTGTLAYAAAQPPTVIVDPTLHTATVSGVVDLFDPQWPDPVGDVTFKLLIDNTPIEVTITATAYTSFGVGIEANLNTELAAYDVVCTLHGTQMHITRTDAAGAGSRARIALYDTSTGPNSMNATFGLANARVSEARGTDVSSSGFSLSSFSTDPTLEFPSTLIYSSSQVPGGVGTGNTTFTLPADHTVISGDSVRIGASWYQVSSVAATSMSLAQEMLYTFNGSALDTTSSYAFHVYRQPLIIRHHSKAHGESLSIANPNTLNFPIDATSKHGTHTQCQLTGGLGLGSPVRLGDVLVSEAGARLGTIRGVQGGALEIAFDANNRFSDTNYGVVAKGAYSYQAMDQRLSEVSRMLSAMPDTTRFEQKVAVFLGSGQNRGLVDADLVDYFSLCQEVISAHGLFAANTVASANQILRAFKENRLLPAHTRLAACQFSELANLDVNNASQLESMQLKIEQVLSSLTGGQEVYIERQTAQGVYAQDLAQDTLLPRVPTVEGE